MAPRLLRQCLRTLHNAVRYVIASRAVSRSYQAISAPLPCWPGTLLRQWLVVMPRTAAWSNRLCDKAAFSATPVSPLMSPLALAIRDSVDYTASSVYLLLGGGSELDPAAPSGLCDPGRGWPSVGVQCLQQPPRTLLASCSQTQRKADVMAGQATHCSLWQVAYCVGACATCRVILCRLAGGRVRDD